MNKEQEIVNVRIEQFMKHKMQKFPELQAKFSPQVEIIHRGYTWAEFIDFFKKKQRA